MKRARLVFLLLVLFPFAYPAQTLDVSFTLHEGYAEITYASLYTAEFPLDRHSEEGNYSLKIIYQNQEAYSTRFDKPIYEITTYGIGEQGGYRQEASNIVSGRIPWFSKEQAMIISEGGNVLFNGTIYQYLCNGNSICENNEDWVGCPGDCPPPGGKSAPKSVLEGTGIGNSTVSGEPFLNESNFIPPIKKVPYTPGLVDVFMEEPALLDIILPYIYLILMLLLILSIPFLLILLVFMAFRFAYKKGIEHGRKKATEEKGKGSR